MEKTIVTVAQLLTAEPVVAAVAEKPVAARHTYALARINRFVSEEKAFFGALRDSLITKYGEPLLSEQGLVVKGSFQILPTMEKFPLYMGAIKEILDQEVVFPFKKLDVAAFGDDTLTASQMGSLEFMLTGFDAEGDEAQDASLADRARERQKALDKVHDA